MPDMRISAGPERGNLAELIAYLWMRPFIGTGDTGRFNQGMNLSP